MDTVVEKDLNNLDDDTEFRRIVFFAAPQILRIKEVATLQSR